MLVQVTRLPCRVGQHRRAVGAHRGVRHRANSPTALVRKAFREPAAGIDDVDRDLLAQAIRNAAGRGLGVLLVEHNVGFVAELSHRMVALVGGEVVAEGKPADVVGDPQVVAAYLGVQRVAA